MSYSRTCCSGFTKRAALTVLLLILSLLLVQTAAAAEITKIGPNEIYQNGTVRIIINGSGLGEATGVDVGPGINVDRLTVDSDTKISVFLTADDDIEIGVRDVSVILPEGEVTLEGALTVKKKGTVIDFLCSAASLQPVGARQLTIGWSVIGLVFGGSLFATRFASRRLR